MMEKTAIYKKTVYALLCVYAAECVLGSSGHWLMLGNVSIRIILFLAVLAVSLPLLIKKTGRLAVNPSVITVLVFLVFLAFGFFKGRRLGNAELFIRGDVTSFLGIAVLPCVLVAADDNKRSERLLDVIFYASVALAAVTVLLHYSLVFIGVSGAVKLNDYLIPRNMGGLGQYDSGLFRVFFRSQFFLQFSAIIGMKKAADAVGGKKLLLELAEGTLFFAVILSFTRGFWLGIVASAVLMFIVNWDERRELFKTGLVSLLMFAALVAVSCALYGKPAVVKEVIHRLDPKLVVITAGDRIDEEYLEDAYGFAAEENIDALVIRKKSLSELKNLILADPVGGYGLGKNLDKLRGDGKAEYMYMDIMMKLGLFGLLSFLTMCLYPSCRYFALRKKHSYGRLVPYSICGFLGVMLTSTFNPFLSTPMGMLMLSTVCAGVYAGIYEADSSAEVIE